MKLTALALFVVATIATAGPTEYNAALDKARKAHADSVKVCKTLPGKADLDLCVNNADKKLAEAEKGIRAKHLPKVAP